MNLVVCLVTSKLKVEFIWKILDPKTQFDVEIYQYVLEMPPDED
jgi:hypothetical protein